MEDGGWRIVLPANTILHPLFSSLPQFRTPSLADMQHHRCRRRVAGLPGPGVAQAVRVGDPRGALEEDLPLGLALGDEDAVQTDVGDDDAVGQVLDVEADGAGEPVPLDAEPRRDELAGDDGDLGDGPIGWLRGGPGGRTGAGPTAA